MTSAGIVEGSNSVDGDEGVVFAPFFGRRGRIGVGVKRSGIRSISSASGVDTGSMEYLWSAPLGGMG